MLKNISNLGSVLTKNQQASIKGGIVAYYGCSDGTTGQSHAEDVSGLSGSCAGHGELVYLFFR